MNKRRQPLLGRWVLQRVAIDIGPDQFGCYLRVRRKARQTFGQLFEGLFPTDVLLLQSFVACCIDAIPAEATIDLSDGHVVVAISVTDACFIDNRSCDRLNFYLKSFAQNWSIPAFVAR